MKRRARTDPVTPELRIAVLERDGGCVQPRLIRFAESIVFPDPCEGRLTLDHIQDGYGRMGKRAPSDLAHLVTLCFHHHLDGWATSHRPELREYLARVDDPHATHVDPCSPECVANGSHSDDLAHEYELRYRTGRHESGGSR